MTREEFVEQQLMCAKQNWSAHWSCVPDESRLRLDGIEAEMRELLNGVVKGYWAIMSEYLDGLANEHAGICPSCGSRRERSKMNKPIQVTILGLVVSFVVTYFYCRKCHKGEAPVRRWLNVADGDSSLRFERATTDLTSRMTFGDATTSLLEQHGQEIDRTKAERVTYEVGREAETYLSERRKEALKKVEQERKTEGEAMLELTADGGMAPVGTLKRPAPEEVTEKTPRTPVRGLPTGTRTIAGREVRLIAAHKAGDVSGRVVDCHIAPYNDTAYTGERMLCTAVEAGLGDNTRMHGVFDMGKWIAPQYEEQFHAYLRTAIADIMHVTGYLTDAGRVVVGKEEAEGFGQAQKRRLLKGDIDGVLVLLKGHQCDEHCEKNDDGKCLARVAERFIINNRKYLDYPSILALEVLSIGSGEAESGIRHILKRRTSVAGAWTEENLKLMVAVLTIRASGWWDDFWTWRNARNIKRWRERQAGEHKPKFRGTPCHLEKAKQFEKAA